jgi:hypothetical protein
MYRRLIGTEVWHSSRECPLWPKSNYDEMEYPSIGKLCPACERREADRDSASRQKPISD